MHLCVCMSDNSASHINTIISLRILASYYRAYYGIRVHKCFFLCLVHLYTFSLSMENYQFGCAPTDSKSKPVPGERILRWDPYDIPEHLRQIQFHSIDCSHYSQSSIEPFGRPHARTHTHTQTRQHADKPYLSNGCGQQSEPLDLV